jgi:hypothetical protein
LPNDIIDNADLTNMCLLVSVGFDYVFKAPLFLPVSIVLKVELTTNVISDKGGDCNGPASTDIFCNYNVTLVVMWEDHTEHGGY